MLPIRDLNPTRTRPVLTWIIILGTAYVFFAIQAGEEAEVFMYSQAAIPCEVITGEPLSQNEVFTGRCESGDRSPIFPGKNVLFAVVASIFFHGGLGHLLSNLWVLAIFGNNVEDVMGRAGYVVFYLTGGLVASAAHIFLHPGSTIPVVGASGAIAGVMGAYAVLYPTARVLSIVPPFFFAPFALPAAVFLAVWFFSQFLLAGASTNIAWEAHVAGFIFGLAIAIFLRRRVGPYRPPPRYRR